MPPLPFVRSGGPAPTTNNSGLNNFNNFIFFAFQKRKPKRPCYYCGEVQSQLLRHIKRKHKNEEAVVAALQLPQTEQLRAFENIRKLGIFKLNLNKVEKGQPLIRERKQGSSSDADLRMCNGCHGFYDTKQIYRHKKRCAELSGTSSSGSVNFSSSWKSAKSLGVSEDFKPVLDSFRNDEAGNLCKSDPFIILLGMKLWAKSIKKEKHVVMAEMRVLANLVLRMRILSLNNNLCAQNVLQRQYFETLSDAIKDNTTRENGQIKPGLKVMIGFLLKKMIKIAKGHFIQAGKMEESVEVDMFSAVLDLNWDYIFYAAQIMCEQRRNSLRKPQAMPIEEDMSKFRVFILHEMQQLTKDEFKKWNHHDFVKMRNLIVSRLTMFNARRGGEPARLTLEEWEDAVNDTWVDPKLVESVKDPLEKVLFSQFKLAYQAGKGSKKLVPILIPTDTLNPIKKLIEERKEVEVSDSNPFLFANTGTSLDHAVGWQSIKAVVKMMGPELEKPELLIADKFRHRMSTLFALLDLPENERATFYRHMGHSESINRHVYQCPLSIGEVVNVGGFLKTVDESATQYICNSVQPVSATPTTATEINEQDQNNCETVVNAQELEELPYLSDELKTKNGTDGVEKKNYSLGLKKGRRYYKWSIKNTMVVKEFFRTTIKDNTFLGSKGSLPGQSVIVAFLSRHSIFGESEENKFSLKEQVALVKTKIFNERIKARSALNKWTK